MATEAQLAANRQNAQLSSGPATSEGKNRSSHNAVKTGLTGQTVLLPTDNVEAYQTHIARIEKQFEPATDEERTLVQAIGDTEWRLLRIPSLEAGILAVGRSKLADLYPNEADPATRACFIEAEVQIAYRKDLSNLALQETRLRRHRTLDTEKLTSLQTARKHADSPRQNMSLAVRMYENATKSGHTFVPELFGFEFSLPEIRASHRPRQLQGQHDRPISHHVARTVRDRFRPLRPGQHQNRRPAKRRSQRQCGPDDCSLARRLLNYRSDAIGSGICGISGPPTGWPAQSHGVRNI